MISKLIYEKKSSKLVLGISNSGVTDKITWDEDGNLILPIKLASLTVISFGEVWSEDHFHSN